MIHEAFIFWAAVAVVILVMWGHTVFDACAHLIGNIIL